MKNYIIFRCPKCTTPLYSSETQKTKKCPKCQKNFRLSRLKILRTVDNLQDAIKIVQKIKIPSGLKINFQKQQKLNFQPENKYDNFLELMQRMQKQSSLSPINENFLFEKAKEAGFEEDWIIETLRNLEKEGLIYRPKRDQLMLI